jgi:hypothetical protein
MAGNKPDVGPANANLVDVTQYNEIRYWTYELKCTPDQLRDAVKAAGNSVVAVKQYLATHR